MGPFPLMPEPTRCSRQGCSRTITDGSPSEFFCCWSCAQAWHADGHQELPMGGSNSRVLSDRQHADEHDVSMAFGWLDSRA